MIEQMQRSIVFLRDGVWRMRVRRLPRRRALALRALRIVLLALRGFTEDRCQLRASALTFYSLLSVVPVLAMAFGIAKGFGFDATLETMIRERLSAYDDIAVRVIDFANSMLDNTRGGLIAGVGVLLLFWSVVKLLANVESSFNDIWGVSKGRHLGRKLVDYLSIMVVSPVLLIVSSSLNVFLISQVQWMAERAPLLHGVGPFVTQALKLLPYSVIWILFTFIYRFIPNTSVQLRAAVVGGMVAGTGYLIVQWAYVTFQVGVAQYNAIYGSFAALPLFLAWIQVSWLVIFLGAEVAFAVENEQRYEFEHDCRRASARFRRLVALRVVQLAAEAFVDRREPPNAIELADASGAPIRLIRSLLDELVECRILAELGSDEDRDRQYQPAMPIDRITFATVIDALERRGVDDIPLNDDDAVRRLEAQLEALEKHFATPAGRQPLVAGQRPAPTTEAALIQ